MAGTEAHPPAKLEAARYGAEMTVLDWREPLKCSQCEGAR